MCFFLSHFTFLPIALQNSFAHFYGSHYHFFVGFFLLLLLFILFTERLLYNCLRFGQFAINRHNFCFECAVALAFCFILYEFFSISIDTITVLFVYNSPQRAVFFSARFSVIFFLLALFIHFSFANTLLRIVVLPRQLIEARVRSEKTVVFDMTRDYINLLERCMVG